MGRGDFHAVVHEGEFSDELGIGRTGALNHEGEFKEFAPLHDAVDQSGTKGEGRSEGL